MNDPELLKLTILGLIYVVLFSLEIYLPHFQNRQHHFSHSLRNLSLAVINATFTSVFSLVVIKQIFTWTIANNLGLLNTADLPPIITFLIAILLIDCWQYIWHRANHVIPILWRFHQVHHSDTEMDASTALRFHPIEIIYSNIARIAIIPILGIQLEHLIAYEIILLPIILFHHSNIKLSNRLDTLMRIILVTPHMHRLHHSDISNETDSNYSSVFSVWDRVFSSFTMRSIEKDFNLGLGGKFKNSEWNRFTGMLVIPFRN